MPRLHGTQFRRVGCVAVSTSADGGPNLSSTKSNQVRNDKDDNAFDFEYLDNNHKHDSTRTMKKTDSFDFDDFDNEDTTNNSTSDHRKQASQIPRIEFPPKSTTTTTTATTISTKMTTAITPAATKNISLVTPTTAMTINLSKNPPPSTTTTKVITISSDKQQPVRIRTSKATASSRSRKRKKKKSSLLSMNDAARLLPDPKEQYHDDNNTQHQNNDNNSKTTQTDTGIGWGNNNNNNNEDEYPLLTQPEDGTISMNDDEQEEVTNRTVSKSRKPGSKVIEVYESPIATSLLLCGGRSDHGTTATATTNGNLNNKYEDVKWMDSVITSSSELPFGPSPSKPDLTNKQRNKDDDTSSAVTQPSSPTATTLNPVESPSSSTPTLKKIETRTPPPICSSSPSCNLKHTQWSSAKRKTKTTNNGSSRHVPNYETNCRKDNETLESHILNLLTTSTPIGEFMFSKTLPPTTPTASTQKKDTKLTTDSSSNSVNDNNIQETNDNDDDNGDKEDVIIPLGTLADVIKLHGQCNTGPLPEPTVAWITLSMMQIASELHSCHVTHNDLGLDSFHVVRRSYGSSSISSDTKSDNTNDTLNAQQDGFWQLQCSGFGEQSHIIVDEPETWWHFEKDLKSIANIICILLLGGSPLSWDKEHNDENNGKLMVQLKSKSFLSDNPYLCGSIAWNDLICALLHAPNASCGAHSIDWTTVVSSTEKKLFSETPLLESSKGNHSFWSGLTDACRLVKSVFDPNNVYGIHSIPIPSKMFLDDISKHFKHSQGIGEGIPAAFGVEFPLKLEATASHQGHEKDKREESAATKANSSTTCENCHEFQIDKTTALEESIELHDKLQTAAEEKESLLQKLKDMESAITELQVKCKAKDEDMRRLDQRHQMKVTSMQEKYDERLQKRKASNETLCKKMEDEIQGKEKQNQDLLQDMAGLRNDLKRQTNIFDERELILTQKLKQARMENIKLKGMQESLRNNSEQKAETVPSRLSNNKDIETSKSVLKEAHTQAIATNGKDQEDSTVEPAQKKQKRSSEVVKELNLSNHQKEEATTFRSASPIDLFGVSGEDNDPEHDSLETPKSSGAVVRSIQASGRSSNSGRLQPSKVKGKNNDRANKVIPGETFSSPEIIRGARHLRSDTKQPNRRKDRRIALKNIIVIDDSSDSDCEPDDIRSVRGTKYQNCLVDFRALREPKQLYEAIRHSRDKLFLVRYPAYDRPEHNIHLVQVTFHAMQKGRHITNSLKNGEYSIDFMTQSPNDIDLPWDESRWRRTSKQRRDESTRTILKLSDSSTFLLGPFDFEEPKPSPKGKRPSKREIVPQPIWKELGTVAAKTKMKIALPPLSFRPDSLLNSKESARRGKRKRT